jgi:kumamolisin
MTERTSLRDSVRALPKTARRVSLSDPGKVIELTIGVRRRADLPDLASLDTTSPTARRYMSRDELKDQFGSDPDSVQRIVDFARAHDLEVLRQDPTSARLWLRGTIANFSAAFGVVLHDYADDTLGNFRARDGVISVPAELANDITGVFGLSNQRHLRRIQNPTLAEAAAAGDAPRAWFLPTELANVYNFPDNRGEGQCIGFLEFGGGVESDSFAAYCTKLGLTAPALKVVALDGVSVDPASDPHSTAEVMLDVEVAGVAAPGASLVAYFSTFDEKGLIDGLSAVLSDSTNDPSVVSISWGWAENQPFNGDVVWSPAAIDHINHSLLAAAHLGITVCVATGDDGAQALFADTLAHVNFPASSPYALAVGGTSLRVDLAASGPSQISETVWNDGAGSGGGGGVSDYIPRPQWQDGKTPVSINPGNFAGRAIPDVAANADPATGYYMCAAGKFSVVGGTSAAAPLRAALIARLNTALGARAGNFNAMLYADYGPSGVLRDITVGDNDTHGRLGGRFAAGVGWDACTGWGVPDGKKLLAAMSAHPG